MGQAIYTYMSWNTSPTRIYTIPHACPKCGESDSGSYQHYSCGCKSKTCLTTGCDQVYYWSLRNINDTSNYANQQRNILNNQHVTNILINTSEIETVSIPGHDPTCDTFKLFMKDY